ncbi:PhoH family protein [Dubosiella newyorkensis]|uniref:PhoH family protein n=1 Tax=Dubosiella newyorkensis TaxID=1862672 RepID=UPI00248BD472|nr:PhoH family protein [Dubosiella newyorkensis]
MEYKTIDCSERSIEEMQMLCGIDDENIKLLSEAFNGNIIVRSHAIKVEEPIFEAISTIIEKSFQMIETRDQLLKQDLHYLIQLEKKKILRSFSAKALSPIAKTRSGKLIYPKTIGQAKLCEAYKEKEIVFATGVAGTGKTYLAVAYAITQLKNESVKKIVLTRPAVEAGESLGFLPGDMKEKVDPYLRPLYDALHEMLGQETTEKLIEKEVIEIAPLAFMRGRTLNEAIVILDEAQNTTKAQMKMFLTRMGKKTKMIVTGDVTQIDLIKDKDSGLIQACQILQGIPEISIVHLGNEDVVRNPLVQKIIERYANVE